MTARPHQLDRSLVIEAPPATVFRYFTDSARWASWWGAGSTIDARPGGRVFVKYPDGNEAAGEVIEITPPSRIVFTYGYVSGAPIPVGASRVTIQLTPAARGTRLTLTHEFAEAAVRDHHIQGWRYQLSLFANLVADESHRDAASRVDAWFGAWAEADAEARTTALGGIATAEVRMRDRFSCVEGIADLAAQIGGAQRFMPGVRLVRDGDARHCQGVVLVDWNAVGPDGQPRGRGTNVFTLAPDGKIESVTGFWR
jgi:uncharacterized protein YndB with AHSA1/START domain